jgi:hypothetical protein
VDDAQYELLKQMFERQRREYNTPELAKQLLQRHGLIDEDGELAEPYRSSDWKPERR